MILESQPEDSALLSRIMGTLHTLKSSSGLIGFDATEAARKALSCVYRTGQRFGVGLCAEHVERAKAPKGWKLIDRLSPATPQAAAPTPSRPRVHGAPGSATNPGRPVWVPTRENDIDQVSELKTASSPLLRRAFRGDMAGEGEIEGQQRLRV